MFTSLLGTVQGLGVPMKTMETALGCKSGDTSLVFPLKTYIYIPKDKSLGSFPRKIWLN